MAKAVFRPGEITVLTDKVVISSPSPLEFVNYIPVEEETEIAQEVEVYTGPTADDLRREAEAFQARWADEREAMIQAAKDQAGAIVLEARENASRELQRNEQDVQELKDQAREEAEKIIAEAQRQAGELEADAQKKIDNERREALEQGREAGRAEGYAEGKTEVNRLIQRTQTVLERAQDKRAEILTETEKEIIDLVLLITRKVVKVISDSQRDVVVANVIQALGKVRDRGTVIIRVNLADLKLTTENTKEFIKSLEGVKSIQVLEDSSVDSGGCIVETDFGEIDARISSQLAELEAKILEISPIKTRMKPKK